MTQEEHAHAGDFEWIRFKNAPIIQPQNCDGEDCFELKRSFRYSWKHPKTGVIYSEMIPRGFIYDGASVPRFAWSILGFHPMGRHNPATIVHDWHYINKGVVNGFKVITRKESDLLYRNALRELGYNKAVTTTIYWALLGFGWTKRRF
jgi:hypothetical protein